MEDKAFKNFRHNAIKLIFPNGNCISTIWGYGTHSDNHDLEPEEGESLTDVFRKFMHSDTVEVLIDCPTRLHNKIHKKLGGDDTIISYVTLEDWLWILNKLK